MTTKAAYHDFIWRMKFLIGLFLFGWFVGGAVFVGHITGWQTLDFSHLFKILPILYDTEGTRFFVSALLGALLFFWLGIFIFWRPWATSNQPEISNNEVKRPW